MADGAARPTTNVALTVVQRRSDGRFLMVRETRNRGWWIPAGRVEHGERFADAAVRETREETGIDIVLEGVLRVEHTTSSLGIRLRVLFFARPRDEAQMAKSTPDAHSEEARWLSLHEVKTMVEGQREKFRNPFEPCEWFAYIERGGRVYDLAVLASEGDPVAMPAHT